MMVLQLLVLLLVFAVYQTDGCTCLETHPQQSFCNAAFVIKAIPQSVVKEPEDRWDTIIVEVKVLESFKGGFDNGQLIKLYSYVSGSMCGIVLDTDNKKQLLISGYVNKEGELRINSCGWIKLWSSLSPCVKQRLSVNYSLNGNRPTILYKDSCECEVKYCYSNSNCEPPKKGCLMKSLSDQRNQTCIENPYNEDVCVWQSCTTPIDSPQVVL